MNPNPEIDNRELDVQENADMGVDVLNSAETAGEVFEVEKKTIKATQDVETKVAIDSSKKELSEVKIDQGFDASPAGFAQISQQSESFEGSKWEVKDLSNPQEFLKAIDLLINFYEEKEKNTNRKSRKGYNKNARDSLKVLRQHAKDRIGILKKYKEQIENKVTVVTPEHINEVAKMLKDAPDFENTIARAAGGKGTEDIRNADYSSKGVEKSIERKEKYNNYINKLNHSLLKDAIVTLENRDGDHFRNYLVAAIEGDLAHPAFDQYYKAHQADILYLSCLDPRMYGNVLKHQKLSGISRKDLGEKYWNQLPTGTKAYFVGDPATLPYTDINQYRSPKVYGGLRGLFRQGMEKITPAMQSGQREMWAQGAELAILGVGIWQLGKWILKKKEKGNWFTRTATVAGIGLGLNFVSQGVLGKDLFSAISGGLNGGKERKDMGNTIEGIFGNKEKMVTKPQEALQLFGTMSVLDVKNLLATEPKSAIYDQLKDAYSQDPKNAEGLALLERMDKNDPTGSLNEYLLAIIPTGKLSTSYEKMSISELAEIRAGNAKAIDYYLRERPELEVVTSKRDMLLEKLKIEQDFLDKDLDQLMAEGYFKVQDKYETKFADQIMQLDISTENKLALREQLNEFAKDNNLGKIDVEIDGEFLDFTSLDKTTRVNIKQQTLPGFKNNEDAMIKFANAGELLRTANLLNEISNKTTDIAADPEKNSGNFTKFIDWTKGKNRLEENWPFYIDGLGNVKFNASAGNETLVGDFLPYFSELKRKYPTLDKHKKFFISYLNEQKNRLNAHLDQ